MRNLLVKLLGFNATLIHGDFLVLDRWRWLRKRLPKTRGKEKFIDIGCGTGAFTTGAAFRGYQALGLTWEDQKKFLAEQRAKILKVGNVNFEVYDVRKLGDRKDLSNSYDVAICFENIEHIINDRKLLNDITNCLKPGGRILLTAPNYHYKPLSLDDMGPFFEVENGAHVRRGYTKAMFEELFNDSGLMIEDVSYCSGFFSQMFSRFLRRMPGKMYYFGWALTLPLRILPLLFDNFITWGLKYPGYSICVEGYKPRFES